MARAAPFVVCLFVAAAAGASPPPPPPAPAITRFTLESGLVVLLREDHRLPTVAVNLMVRAGSGDEAPGRTGLAHLFEHLMFMGTARVPRGELDAVIEAAGGSSNATTDEDRTSYLDLGPAHLLPTLLYLEADRLATLPAALTVEKLDLQREVVENERRQAFENRPYGQVELLLPELLYPPGHPYHHNPVGSPADLRAASLDDLRAFFARAYPASNASLAVVGDFKSDEARGLVERYFGALPRRPPLERPRAATVGPLPPRRRVVREPVEAPQVTLAFPSPAAYQPGDAACALLAALLAGGRSSRLEEALVRGRPLAQAVEAEQRSGRWGGQLVVTALGEPGQAAARLERALLAELDRLARQPPTEAELERARALVQTALLGELEHGAALAERMSELEEALGDAGEVERLAARYDAVTAAELVRVAREVIVGRRHATVVVVPSRSTPARPPGVRR